MSGIVKVASWSGKPRASVIFVHGPGGEAYDTWRRAPDDQSFWPLWLAEDIAGSRACTVRLRRLSEQANINGEIDE